VEKSWDGFLTVSQVLNEDWGFSLPLDEEHSRCKVIVVASTKDTIGKGMAEFVAQSHPNSQLKVVEGGHIGVLPHINSLWKELLD
jgi:predicted alpha/beta hydrolase family esterase